MRSQWFEYKDLVIKLRTDGTSIGDINKKYKIPKSTLSGWFRKIKLSPKQRRVIYDKSSIKMASARKKAVLWHNHQKELRLNLANKEATNSLVQIDIGNKHIIELALSFLYLGEGSKQGETSLGNTNPKILLFFIESLEILYNINRHDLKCSLHIRSDQNPNLLLKYWSNILNIPIKNFSKTSIDKRTVKSKTYPDYKGVCVIRPGGLHIKRKLMFLSEQFCDKITNIRTISSVGRALS